MPKNKVLIRFVFFILFFSISFAKQPLKIVYFDSFPPYCWKDGNGNMKGILVDIMNEVIAKKMGIKISHEGYPWERAQNKVKNGEADIFITGITKERLQYSNVSKESVIETEIVLFVSAANSRIEKFTRIKSIGDLSKFKIVDYIGDGWGELNLSKFDKVLVPNLTNSFKMINAGRAELAATDMLVGKHVLGQNKLNKNIVELPVILDKINFYLFVGEKSEYKNIIFEFDKNMKKFKKEKKLEEIYKKYQ